MSIGEWDVLYFVRLDVKGKSDETKFMEVHQGDEATARQAYTAIALPKRLEKAVKTNDEFGTVVGVGKKLLERGTAKEEDYLAASPAK